MPATNGIEAVDMAKNAKLDVVVMGRRMPGMTGFDALREIREIDPRVKIILISADAGIESEALKAGASVFLHKPVKPKEMVRAVNGVLKADKHRAWRVRPFFIIKRFL